MIPLVIGVGLSNSVDSGTDPVAAAIRAEQLGFDFVSVSDHPAGSQPTYETLTLLTWVAARTEHIGIATRVLGVPFRRPAMVAKAAESLHRLSGGRLIVGLGGGYSDDEIRALGGSHLSPRAKVGGMIDAIEILHRVWRDQSASYDGDYYRIAALQVQPKPVAAPPIWLGTYGPRALTATGQLADGWIPSLGHLDPVQIPQMMTRIADAASAQGRPDDAVRAVLNLEIDLSASSSEADTAVISGSASQVLDRIGQLLDLGFSGLNIMPRHADDIEKFATDVLPHLPTGR